MTFWDPVKIRAVLGGTWLARPGPRPIEGASTDTRTLKPNQVFFALRGENFDAHRFLRNAALAGSPLLVIDDPDALEDQPIPEGVGILKVNDTLDAMAHLASAYRRTLDTVRVIGVTGSNGKTTTVRLIDGILGGKLRGTASIKSYNNLIGVSLTVLSARPSDQYLVCEVGMNAPGEISPLARIIDPDIAVITSIGRAHIEAFGSVEGIAREKAVLLSYLRPNGLAIIPADEPLLDDYTRPIPNVILFGEDQSATLRLSSVERSGRANSIDITVNGRSRFTVPLLGRHNARNALAAIAVARRLGLSDEEIAQGLGRVAPAESRFSREIINGVDVFDDAYNASPESMDAAIETFASLTVGARRRVLILGDMLELGDASMDAHLEVAERILDHFTPDFLVTVGSHALHIADRVSQASSHERVMILSELDDAQARKVVARLRADDAVLVKGSRRVGLERVVQTLRKHGPGAGSGASPRTPSASA